jgi:signal peptidase I
VSEPRSDGVGETPPSAVEPSSPTRLEAGRQRTARRRRAVLEYVIIAAAAVGIALLVQAFLVKPYRIPSESMLDTLRPGDRVFVNRFVYHFREVHRGDIVVFKAPGSGVVLIKRVIGLPGETISLRDGRVYIDGKVLNEPYVRRVGGQVEPTEAFPTGTPWALADPYTVPAGCYFMMGDNRTDSGDSREFGAVSHTRVIGTAFFIYWPITRIRIL